MSVDLTGKVVALIGTGSEADRAVTMACAEAGAQLALATHSGEQAQEFAMNSIANEAWAVGADQFVVTMDAVEPGAVTAFAAEVMRRYGRCDAVVVCEAEQTPLLGPNAAEAFRNPLGTAGRFVVVTSNANDLPRIRIAHSCIQAWEPADIAFGVISSLT